MFTRKLGKLVVIVSLFLLFSPAASAQITSIMPGAITVVGEGYASAPAETADIAITIGSDSMEYVEPMTIEPATSSIPAAVNVDAVMEAIIVYGIPVNDVEVIEPAFMGEWGAGMSAQPTTILVMMTNPTVDTISELLEVVSTSAHAEGLYINQFGVVYGVEDCRSLRQQARVNAVAHARSEAEDQAAALNTTLGDPIATRDTYPMNPVYYAVNTCTTMPEAEPQSMVYMAGQFDPNLPAEVMVTVAVEVSFEIP